jgi:hypothetical protein
MSRLVTRLNANDETLGSPSVAVRTIKLGVQNLSTELMVDIGFLFKKQTNFETGIRALQSTDPLCARRNRHFGAGAVDLRPAVHQVH